jgi:hypothetical protein
MMKCDRAIRKWRGKIADAVEDAPRGGALRYERSAALGSRAADSEMSPMRCCQAGCRAEQALGPRMATPWALLCSRVTPHFASDVAVNVS